MGVQGGETKQKDLTLQREQRSEFGAAEKDGSVGHDTVSRRSCMEKGGQAEMGLKAAAGP